MSDIDHNLKDSLETIYRLFEFDIKKILRFYSKHEILKKEKILNDYAIINGNHKTLNNYIFIKEYGIPIDPVILKNEFHILSDEFYYVNKVNYSSAVEILAVFEKYISKFIFEIIQNDTSILKNISHDIKINSKDLCHLIEYEELRNKSNDLLLIRMAWGITKNMLNNKNSILKEITKLLGIKGVKNEKVFKYFIEIRNIICHLNGSPDYDFSYSLDRDIRGYTLYLRSENITEVCTYILEAFQEVNKAYLEKLENNLNIKKTIGKS